MSFLPEMRGPTSSTETSDYPSGRTYMPMLVFVGNAKSRRILPYTRHVASHVAPVTCKVLGNLRLSGRRNP